MPAGVTWGVYLRYSCAAFLSMMAGAQVVHVCYNPLSDLQDLVKAEKKKLYNDCVNTTTAESVSRESLNEGH